jgi:hypothetical protein
MPILDVVVECIKGLAVVQVRSNDPVLCDVIVEEEIRELPPQAVDLLTHNGYQSPTHREIVIQSYFPPEDIDRLDLFYRRCRSDRAGSRTLKQLKIELASAKHPPLRVLYRITA